MSYPLLILAYAFFYLVSLTLPELSDKPFVWIAAMLAVVATLFSMTKGNDIRRYSSWAFRATQRYPVILRQYMPESARSATNGTSVVKVSKATIPISSGKGGGQAKFASATTGRGYTVQLFIILRVFFLSLVLAFSVVFTPLSFACLLSLTIIMITLCLTCPKLFRVCLIPTTAILFYAFRVITIPFFAVFSSAFSATSAQRVIPTLICCKIFSCFWIFFSALCATLKGVGLVQHSVSLSLYLKMRSASGEISRWFGYPLADSIIIPRKDAL